MLIYGDLANAELYKTDSSAEKAKEKKEKAARKYKIRHLIQCIRYGSG